MLYYAYKYNQTSIKTLLLKHRIFVNFEAFYIAFMQNDISVFCELLQYPYMSDNIFSENIDHFIDLCFKHKHYKMLHVFYQNLRFFNITLRTFCLCFLTKFSSTLKISITDALLGQFTELRFFFRLCFLNNDAFFDEHEAHEGFKHFLDQVSIIQATCEQHLLICDDIIVHCFNKYV